MAHFEIEDEMPNTLQSDDRADDDRADTVFGEATRLVVDAADVAAKARADRGACDADMMFDAVCCRLARLVDHGAAPQAQAGVLECVAALKQLHEDVIDQRARYRRCEHDLVAARTALAAARVDIAVHLTTTYRDAVRPLAAGSAGGAVAGRSGTSGEQLRRR